MKLTSLKSSFPVAIVLILCVFSITSITGCFPTPPPQPSQIIAPAPRMDNEGAFMCPYTQDGVVAEWVDKAINAKIGATIGRHVGAYAGQKALEQIPFVGGWLGGKAGEALGREIAVKASGGWDYIKSTSDLSFDTMDDLSIYLYATFSTNEHFQQVLEATMEIYPKMKMGYHQALQKAPIK